MPRPARNLAFKASYEGGTEEPTALEIFLSKVRKSPELSEFAKAKLSISLPNYLFNFDPNVKSGEDFISINYGNAKVKLFLAIMNVLNEMELEWLHWGRIAARNEGCHTFVARQEYILCFSHYRTSEGGILSFDRFKLDDTHLHRIQKAVEGLKFFEDEANHKNNVVNLTDNKRRKILGNLSEYFSIHVGEAQRILDIIGDSPLNFINNIERDNKAVNFLPNEKVSARISGEDAIAFYERVWVPLLAEGRVFREDMEAFDPGLIDAVINRAKRLAKKNNSSTPSEYYPTSFLPPRRPAEPQPERVVKQREGGRRRQATFRAKHHEP